MLKKELEKELNRTKLILDYAREEIKTKEKEIERLNNIINELEKWLKYEISKSGFEQDYEIKSCYEDIFEELQELKGSVSNE